MTPLLSLPVLAVLALAAPAPAWAQVQPLALPAGIQMLPAGGWRVGFAAEAQGLADPAMEAAITEIGRRLAAGPEGRITLLAQASGPAADVSAARRASLARALAVKGALVAGGLAETRIDLRPMGRTAETADAVDILPPEARPAAPPNPAPGRP